MADISELFTGEAKEYFAKSRNCKSSEERRKLIQEDNLLNESNESAEYPYVDMSLEDFIKKYNLVVRDETQWNTFFPIRKIFFPGRGDGFS